MANYIDRQAAIEELNKYAENLKEVIVEDDHLIIDVFTDTMKRAISKIPAAPPLMRSKGFWKEITESELTGYDPYLAGYYDPVSGYDCSECGGGYEKEVMGDTLWNFCPNCGADMREVTQ